MKPLINLLIILFALMIPIVSRGTTYYVDFASGSDTSNGTSTATPWQHCPGDAKATGMVASAALAAGDSVILKGGVSYTNSIMVNWSGTTGNPITYDGNSAGTWGSGKAILDGLYLLTSGVPGLPNYGANLILTNRANIAIRNFQIQHAGGVPMNTYKNYSYPTNLLPAVYGIGVLLWDDTNILVSDCFLQEMGYWTNTFPVNTSPTGQNGYGISMASCINATVTNCIFQRIPYAIGVSAGGGSRGTVCSNIVISTCDFSHYMNWIITISPNAAGVTVGNILITNNTFHDCWETTSAYWWNGDANNGGGFPHFDGIFMGIASLSNIVYTNIVIANNLFYWNNTNGGGTAWINTPNMGGNISILNNVFLGGYNAYGNILINEGPYTNLNCSPKQVLIANNTSLGGLVAVNGYVPDGSDPLQAPNSVRIFNNISYATNHDNYITPISINFTTNKLTACDYNVYYVWADGAQQDIIYNVNFPAWQARGYDVHGHFATNGISKLALPLFQDITAGLGFNSSQNNVRLIAGSAAIGAGNQPVWFICDRFYRSVSWHYPWDIGAYQGTNAPVPPPPASPSGGGLPFYLSKQ
jgi:hypothetical protein